MIWYRARMCLAIVGLLQLALPPSALGMSLFDRWFSKSELRQDWSIALITYWDVWDQTTVWRTTALHLLWAAFARMADAEWHCQHAYRFTVSTTLTSSPPQSQ